MLTYVFASAWSTVQEAAPVTEVETRLSAAYDELLTRGYQLLAFAPLLAIAAFVLMLFWGLAWVVGRRDRFFHRLSPNRFVQDLLRQVAKGVLILAGILLALEILDATALVGVVLGAAASSGSPWVSLSRTWWRVTWHRFCCPFARRSRPAITS